ncbi:MAG: (2Fe-2S)-binding protein [Neomegalonema sp.]
MAFMLTVNGVAREMDVDADTPLLWALRDTLNLTGTKFGCGVAACGACTVHLDGVAVRSCQATGEDATGAEVTTIEGLSGPEAEAVQGAWRDLNVVQCGYCQSGQIMQAVSLLKENPSPTDAEIQEEMNGNLCRCATYSRVGAAVRDAADRLA